MKRIPNVGEILPAFDDGKIRFSRLYETTILQIIPFNDALSLEIDGLLEDGPLGCSKAWLVDIWLWNLQEYDWLFANETDCFIMTDMKNEVANPNYFALTKDGGWFSMNVQNFMQGARLDSDLELYKFMITDGYASPDWCGNACNKEIEKYNKLFGL